MKRVIFLLVLVASCWSQDDVIDDYDQLPPCEYYDYNDTDRATDNCLCVPPYLCMDGVIVDDGSNVLDFNIEELPLDQIPPECGPFYVCCRLPPAPIVRPCQHLCGISNLEAINAHIVKYEFNGETLFGEFPWQAAILKRDGDDFIFQCGGTLIDEKHIITVAHCVDKLKGDIDSMVVRLGEWDSQKTTEFLPHEDFDVEDIVIHPKYKKKNLRNDIAVIVLDREVSFKPHIRSVCLPWDDDDFTQQQCTVTGWGTSSFRSDVFSGVLQQDSVPMFSRYECQLQLRETRLGAHFRLYKDFLCAGGSFDSCKGDDGAPLVCYTPEDSFTVVGLMSWGGTEGVPGVFVNVMKYNDWIASVTGKPMKKYWRRLIH